MTTGGIGMGGMGDDFLRAITAHTQSQGKDMSANRPVKLGRVDVDYDSNTFLGGINPRILFDGETVLSQKQYPSVPSYIPKAGDRVCLIPVGTTYLIIGSVETPSFPVQVDTFTSSDTWSKPVGARYIRVQVQAGGAGGAGAAAPAAGEASMGGGGGGGAYGEALIVASAVNDAETVTIGAGGAGGSGGGGTGGTSSFGLHLSAVGGLGGATRAASAVAFGAAGGAGSTTISGTAEAVLSSGDAGGMGWGSGQLGISGGGGSSFMGGGGVGRLTVSSAQSLAGNPGRLYGGGGGGAISSGTGAASTGGNGAAGIIIVTTYF